MNLTLSVGFDYALAMRKLNQRYTYLELADLLGYASSGSIHKLINGALPNHPVGEAIWVLYRETFGEKPPHGENQARGLSQPPKRTI